MITCESLSEVESADNKSMHCTTYKPLVAGEGFDAEHTNMKVMLHFSQSLSDVLTLNSYMGAKLINC